MNMTNVANAKYINATRIANRQYRDQNIPSIPLFSFSLTNSLNFGLNQEDIVIYLR